MTRMIKKNLSLEIHQQTLLNWKTDQINSYHLAMPLVIAISLLPTLKLTIYQKTQNFSQPNYNSASIRHFQRRLWQKNNETKLQQNKAEIEKSYMLNWWKKSRRNCKIKFKRLMMNSRKWRKKLIIFLVKTKQ